MMANDNSTDTPAPRKKHTWLKLVLAGLLCVGLLWIALLARDVLLLRSAVLSLQDYVEALPAPVQPTQLDMNFLEQQLTALDQNLTTLRGHAAPLLAIAPALGWLPQVGGDVQAAPTLLDMALQFTALGQRTTASLASDWPPGDQLSLESAARIAQQLQPEAAALRAKLDQAAAIRSGIDAARLSARLQKALAVFDEYYPMLKSGLSLLAVAPQLLGADRPRTYLILLQNEDELRASGGFISAVGRITLDSGKIISLTVEDSYQLDDFTKPYPEAPAPLRDDMGIELWVFRDSNWSPDFPTAARQVIQSYTQTRQDSIDGVIALDQAAVEALVSGLGPLPLDPAQPPLTASDIRQYMRTAWSTRAPGDDTATWYAKRKAFIGQLLQVILARITTGGGQIHWVEEGRQLDRVLQRRDLQIAFSDPDLNQALHAAGFDGALRNVAGDYVSVIDSNLGYNKVNAAVQESFAYTVTLGTQPQAELTVIYTQTGQPIDRCIHQVPSYSGDTQYESLVQQCYWDYRRVYVPSGVELLAASRHPTQPGELITGRLDNGATSTTVENDKTVLGTLLIVPRGQQVSSWLRYTLPANVLTLLDKQLQYRLTWQKQAGAGDWPVQVTVNWTSDYRLGHAQPRPIVVTNQSAIFQFTLDADQEVVLDFIQ